MIWQRKDCDKWQSLKREEHICGTNSIGNKCYGGKNGSKGQTEKYTSVYV